MSFIQAVILGIVQGLTEFLPISSSGHLVLFQHAFGVTEEVVTFDIALHLGTLVPVFIVYWQDIWRLLRHPAENGKTWLLLILGTIPAVCSALLFEKQIEALFNATLLLAVGFTITGVALIFADRARGGAKSEREMTVADALIIGAAQAVAIAPSISRSGSTVSAALLRGVNREAAARYSFLLSIPAIGGAAMLQLIKIIRHGAEATGGGVAPLYMFAGAVAACAAGYVSIRFMISAIKKAKLKYFAYYVFAVAGLILVDTLLLQGAIFGKA